RERTRENFFEGFSVGLVTSANGASRNYIIDHFQRQYPPSESVFPEKSESFRKLHNIGLELGIRQGKKFNTVDKENFFTYLHSHLPPSDRAYFNPRIPWKDWSNQKKKEYYDNLSNMVKREMLENDLQLKVE